MKFALPRDILEDVLKSPVKAASSNKSLQILHHVLVKADGEDVKIVGANPEYTVIVSTKANVSKDGEVLILGETLFSLVKNLPNSEVILSSQDDILSVSCSGTEKKISYSLQTVPASEYPSQLIQIENPTITFEIPQGELKKAISKLSRFASDEKDSVEPIFTGIFFDFDENGNLNIVSSDTKRLGLYKTKYTLTTDASRIKFIVPVSSMEVVKDVLSNEGVANIGIFLDDNIVRSVMFVLGDVVLKTNTIVGNYPDYNKVIPQTVSNLSTINKEELNSALKRVSILVDKETNKVVFSFGKGKLKVITQNSMLGIAEEEISCDFDGNSEEIFFNYKFIQDYLASIEDQTFSWGWNSPESVNKFWVENSNFIYVAMPLRK